MWALLDDGTRAMEVPGLGVILAVRECGVAFVPGARLLGGRVVRDDRTSPPLVNGVSAEDIRARAIPDPGARQFYVEDSDY